MNYNDLVTAWADLLPQQTINVGGTLQFNDVSGRYQNEIPRAIEYAEGRMYRDPDFDFLATRQTDSTQTTTAGSRYVTIPSTFIVLERLNLITPAGLAPDANGASRVPLIRTTQDAIDMMWPEASSTAAPQYGLTSWAVFDQQETSPASKVRIAPTPDATYTAEFQGTFRPTPLQQAANATTFLTTYLPDIFLVATMLHWVAMQKAWGGASADDPQAPVTWESQYRALKAGAAVEEARKKSLSAGASPFPPAPLAQQPR